MMQQHQWSAIKYCVCVCVCVYFQTCCCCCWQENCWYPCFLERRLICEYYHVELSLKSSAGGHGRTIMQIIISSKNVCFCNVKLHKTNALLICRKSPIASFNWIIWLAWTFVMGPVCTANKSTDYKQNPALLKHHAWINKQPLLWFIVRNKKRGKKCFLLFHQSDLQTNHCYDLAVGVVYLLCQHRSYEVSVFSEIQGWENLKGMRGKSEPSALWNGIQHCLFDVAFQQHMFLLTLHPWVW